MAISVATAVTWVVATARQPSQPAVGIGAEQATVGSTTRSIAAEPRIETGPPQTGLGGRHGAAVFPSARRLRGNRLGGRAAIWRATAQEEAV